MRELEDSAPRGGHQDDRREVDLRGEQRRGLAALAVTDHGDVRGIDVVAPLQEQHAAARILDEVVVGHVLRRAGTLPHAAIVDAQDEEPVRGQAIQDLVGPDVDAAREAVAILATRSRDEEDRGKNLTPLLTWLMTNFGKTALAGS